MQKIYFITGTQHLYGKEIFDTIIARSKEITEYFSRNISIKCDIEFLGLGTKKEEIDKLFKKAESDEECIGVITWMHTFSPSKMWINALRTFSKPICHLHTQYNKKIPFEEIDMDFMNLNQAAHGDREHGHIYARLRKPRCIATGYWKEMIKDINSFARVVVGVHTSLNLNVVRFGDNMRNVAVTEGDKVEAEIKLGWSVNTHPVGDLVEYVNTVTDEEVSCQMAKYKEKYNVSTDKIENIEYQAKLQVATRKFLEREKAGAFTNTFEDLHGLNQLSGIASQDLMAEGYGYGGEGDWKTSAMVHILKKMGEDKGVGTSFMEDYTYHFVDDEKYVLGAHMLEVCPTIAATKPEIKVVPLGIGGKADPARLTFESKAGDALQVSLVDLGNRFRLIVAECEAITPLEKMPNLPVASTMWKLKPNFEVGTKAWLLAGGAHHTVMTYDVSVEELRYFADHMDIEFVHIGEDTKIDQFKAMLDLRDMLR